MDLMPRIIRIVLSPRDEWARIAGERWQGALLYTFVLSVVPALASYAMARNWDLPSPVRAGAATYLACALTLCAVAGAFWLLARMVAPGARLRGCFQVAAYGATPVLVASAALVSPVLVLVCMVAALHVFYLYYLGVQQLLGVAPDEAAQFVALALALAIGAATLGGGAVGALGLL
jgi:hypothetical protein